MHSTFKGIHASTLPLTDEVYTFVEHNGTATHIAASALARAIKRSGIIPVLAVMDPSLIACIERGDLNQEEHHALKLPDAALDEPVIVGEWGDEHVMIDGTHRVWRRYMRGDRDFPAYLIPETCWRHFVIIGMPDEDVTHGEWQDYLKNSRVRA